MEARTGTEKKLKALFVDGGPRKKNNTAQMLESAMKGASEAGAETTLIRLYDLNFCGCKSCFACKLKNAKTDGVCAIKDGLRSALEIARQADIIVIGSPVYFGYPSAETRAFMERLLFPNYTYDLSPEGKPLVPIIRKRTAIIFTMNAPESVFEKINYPILLGTCADQLKFVFGHSEVLYSYDTLQFSDYSRYAANMFNEEAKRRRHEEVFPKDLEKAYELGKRLVKGDDAK